MNVLTQPHAIRESMALYEALRRLSYPPEAIFFATDDATPCGVGIVLRFEGKEGPFICGFVEESADTAEAIWREVSQGINDNTIPDHDLNEIYRSSKVRVFAETLVATLDKAGIRIPATEGAEGGRERDPKTMN